SAGRGPVYVDTRYRRAAVVLASRSREAQQEVSAQPRGADAGDAPAGALRLAHRHGPRVMRRGHYAPRRSGPRRTERGEHGADEDAHRNGVEILRQEARGTVLVRRAARRSVQRW